MPIIAGGVIEKGGKYLLVQEGQRKFRGLWNVPSGHVDEDELLTTAAIREVKEETGLDVELTGVCQIGTHIFPGEAFALIMFTTRVIGGKVSINHDEILDARWFTYEEVVALGDKLRGKDRIIHVLDNVRKGMVAPMDLVKVYESCKPVVEG